VLNSQLSSSSVALSNCLTTMFERKDTIEVLLALGATRFEASREVVRKSVQLGLTPMSTLEGNPCLYACPPILYVWDCH
jgi:ABC-type iron transport system FetAB permease component